jgi:uncharacterized protein (DUF849 family)
MVSVCDGTAGKDNGEMVTAVVEIAALQGARPTTVDEAGGRLRP